MALSLPDGVRERPPEDLGAVPLPAYAGLSVQAHRGWDGPDMSVRAVCVRAPSEGWAAGLESIVLGHATQLARQALGPDVGALRSSDIVVDGHRFRQTFRGEAGSSAVGGVHVLGFSTEGGAEAVLCTVVCRETASAGACTVTLGSLEAGGAWSPAPPPSLLVRGALLAAERPLATLAFVAFALISIVWVILARRPRTRVP